MKYKVNLKKITAIYFFIAVSLVFYIGLYKFDREYKKNLNSISKKFSDMLNHQEINLEYIEKKITPYLLENKENEIPLILKKIEDTFYFFSSGKNILPSTINWVNSKNNYQVIGSYGIKNKLSLATDLDYYYECENNPTAIHLSYPYLSPKIEDLYVIHIGKGISYSATSSIGCIDMKFSFFNFLRAITDYDLHNHFKYAIKSNKDKLYFIYDKKQRSFIKNNLNLKHYKFASLDKENKINLGINISLSSKVYFIWIKMKLSLILIIIGYFSALALTYLLKMSNEISALNDLRSSLNFLGKEKNQFSRGKNLFKEINHIISDKFYENKKITDNLLSEIDSLKKKLINFNNTNNSLEKISEENNLIKLAINTEKKYGDIIKKNIDHCLLKIEKKIKIISSYFSDSNDITFSKNKIYSLVQSLHNDIKALNHMDSNLNNFIEEELFNYSISAIINDVINLNKSTAYAKNIKICLNMKNDYTKISTNHIALIRGLSAILHHLILEAPNDSNIFINSSFINNKLQITFKDDSFGYINFNSDKAITNENFFDIKSIGWDEIQELIKNINGIINIKNITYEGNTIELIIPCHEKTAIEDKA